MSRRKKTYKHRDKISQIDKLFNSMVARPVGKSEIESQPKAQKALQLRQDKIKQMPVFLNRAKKPLQAMLTFYKAVQQMKMFVLKKMNQAMAIGSFSQTDNGLEVTEPEGFVAVDKSGNAVKLVDRLGFSRRNLTAVSKFKK